jgi:nitrogen-specific signal transduction histidine kinase
MAQKNRDAALFFRGRLPGRTTSNILQGESRLFKLQTAMENSTKPVDAVANLRALAHDLSNSLETVLQAAYLLQMARLDDRNKKWAQVIDGAARDAARINGEIRKILNAQG